MGDRTPRPHWRRSSFCAPEDCIEVALTDQGVQVRDSNLPDRPVLSFERIAWTEFLAELPTSS
ncbi:DUF397 domain-containing protein [Streptomyces sp. NPDC037389]|uniref:DUF397 domain-containing protein n=1 Tax=Streptomyces sp. NPDC037389 TaxID=3155369 RepID=UPI0033D4B62E